MNIVIIGASTDRAKFSNKAVRAYLSQGWMVFPVNPNYSVVEGLKCFKSVLDISERIDVASLYVPSSIGLKLVKELKQKNIPVVYLNPGAESDELVSKLSRAGIQSILKCSILALGINPDEL